MSFLRRHPRVEERIAEPVDPVALAVEQLRRVGADPDAPHPTRHFLYLPGVKPAQRAARLLARPDRQVAVETSARLGFWLVVVSQRMPVTAESLAAARAEFTAVTQQLGGEYERWQVDLAAV